ncbi:esterase-like activity of phytase family protein [Larkinella insperata]|uniref:Esterase-like activity of phytase family protein n=1 Tax=Larkinella insperata TaxID=332158 RepID=A0ABW3QE64_9BACT|nr:esterase-like activity of phytase family protein [Larkinella insperata]
MKYLLSLLFCCLLSVAAHCQTVSFSFNDYLTFPHSRNLHGISGMEFIPARQEWQLAADRGNYYVFRNLHQITDWVCAPDSVFQTGLYVESVRYDAPTDTYFFSVETDDESYVGFKKHAMPGLGETFGRIPLPHPLPVDRNKGIEALALTPNYLWVAPEAGSVEEARIDNPLIHFYRYKKTGDSVVFDAEFSYEIDRNVCPTDSNEKLGGISEMIALPGDESRLLVLERCYEPTTRSVTAKLYEAQIDEARKKLIKLKDKPAFDFNSRSGFRPDNLEAMTWGEDNDGHKTLFILSDDNISKNQWTQLIILEMK